MYWKLARGDAYVLYTHFNSQLQAQYSAVILTGDNIFSSGFELVPSSKARSEGNCLVRKAGLILSVNIQKLTL